MSSSWLCQACGHLIPGSVGDPTTFFNNNCKFLAFVPLMCVHVTIYCLLLKNPKGMEIIIIPMLTLIRKNIFMFSGFLSNLVAIRLDKEERGSVSGSLGHCAVQGPCEGCGDDSHSDTDCPECI